MSIKYKPICYGKIYGNNDRDNDACNQSNRKRQKWKLSSQVSKNTTQRKFIEQHARGLHSNFSLLRDAAYETKSKIDDGIMDLVLEAVQDSADRGGIVLS